MRELACPYGCGPEHPIDALQAAQILNELELLDPRAGQHQRIGRPPSPLTVDYSDVEHF